MKISIVIPTYNRIKQLKQCIDSLQEQDFPAGQAQIIVIDDAADPNVRLMLERFDQARFPAVYFSQDSRGPAAARNLGIRHAQADIIAFIDDDCLADKNWLMCLYQAHVRYPEYAAVGGDTLIGHESTAARIGQFLSTCSIQTQIKEQEQTIFFPTCNVAIKKTIFNTVRFNEDFPLPGGEDLEFFWQVFKQGDRMLWEKKARVWHYRDKSLKSFIRQAYNYGQGNYYVQHIHKDHPLLKELKTGPVSFWTGCAVNIFKIPRFSYILGAKMIKQQADMRLLSRIKVYALFALHKIIYIAGNIAEYLRVQGRAAGSDAGQLNIPQLLILDITHDCNLQCRICDIWKSKTKEKDLDLAVIKKLLLQAKQLGIPEIALSGGEPLLRGDMIDILKYAAKLKIKDLGILTNGIALKEKLARLKPYLIDRTIVPVISLDSLEPQVHDYIRNSRQAHHKTMEAIKALLVLKAEYPRIKINIISIILDQNLEQLPLLAKHLKDMGIDSLQFQGLLSNNLDMAQRRSSEFWISGSRLAVLDDTLDRLISLKKEDPDFIRNSAENLMLLKKYFRGQLLKTDVNCTSADKTFLVSNRGMCTTCFSAYGDAKNRQLKQIMQDKQTAAAQKAVKSCSWPCLLPCFCDR